jgi:hypothetical protein
MVVKLIVLIAIHKMIKLPRDFYLVNKTAIRKASPNMYNNKTSISLINYAHVGHPIGACSDGKVARNTEGSKSNATRNNSTGYRSRMKLRCRTILFSLTGF